MTAQLEISVTSAGAARLAIAHGADRVELCSALEVDGITPSGALLRATIETGAPTHVLIRSRPGDFVYDGDEVALMAADAALAAQAGAAGVVVGALTPEGDLDLPAIATMIDAARAVTPGIEITIHRAVDAAAGHGDPVRRTAQLAGSDLAPTRILSSGGRPAAGDALDVLRAMVRAAGDIQVMAGGGVTPSSIPAIVGTGVAAVHMSAKQRLGDHWGMDPAVVAAARSALGTPA